MTLCLRSVNAGQSGACALGCEPCTGRGRRQRCAGFPKVAISEINQLRRPMRRSRHWPRSTSISLSASSASWRVWDGPRRSTVLTSKHTVRPPVEKGGLQRSDRPLARRPHDGDPCPWLTASPRAGDRQSAQCDCGAVPPERRPSIIDKCQLIRLQARLPFPPGYPRSGRQSAPVRWRRA